MLPKQNTRKLHLHKTGLAKKDHQESKSPTKYLQLKLQKIVDCYYSSFI